MSDKFKATWVSYSSISDFLKCPRAYYLKNMYKNPETGRKISVTKPALSLGAAVHNTLEPLAKLKPDKRFDHDLLEAFDLKFSNYIGKKGGFEDKDAFEEYRKRGHKMLENVLENRHLLKNPTHTLDKDLLDAWLSKEENIVICGKIDWIDENPHTGALSIIDFKTSKEEENNPLQLQIYALLLHILNKETVNKLYYWYLNLYTELTEAELPDARESHATVLELGKRIRDARAQGIFECPRGGCFACNDLETVVRGGAEQVGIGEYNREIYYVQ
jgi:ATP-dependent helicase/DNAse subunit B